jgi:hypothetical protein
MPDKQRERWYFEALRRALPEIPAGTPEEPEPPDFVVGDGSQRLGLELTVFHLPPAVGERPHQEQQSLKDHIVSAAEAIHADWGGPALYVSIYFDPHRVLTKKNIQPLSREIASSILRAPSPRSMREPVELEWGQRPQGISGVQIHPSVDGHDKLWHADSGGWVADITSTHIARIVAAKSRVASLARGRCDRLWLVVVHDLFSRAAPAELTTDAAEATYHGPFDRLIWLTPHSPEQTLQLKLNCAAA